MHREVPAKPQAHPWRKALKCNVFLRHLEDYAAMNEVYRGRFGPEPPVRTTVAVAGIPLDGCLVEIEIIAALP